MRDEYFCTNCNAILNYQSGFDPNIDSWTCTECGTRLIADDAYEGKSFKGVIWYCDDCGALLNRQSGFSDSCGSWRCKKCGHKNPISEDEIISEDELITCPSCNRALNKQFCFYDFYNDWECTYCGAKLHRDNSDDPFEVVDEDLYSESSNYDSDSNDSSDNSFNYTNSRSSCDNQDDVITKIFEKGVSALFKVILWIFKMVGKLIFFVCKEIFNLFKMAVQYFTDPQKDGRISKKDFALMRMKALLFKRKLLPINNYCYDLLHIKVDKVKVILYNSGFKNIKVIPIKDINYEFRHRIGEVEQVVINGTSFFEPEDIFPYNTQIIITYHDKIK